MGIPMWSDPKEAAEKAEELRAYRALTEATAETRSPIRRRREGRSPRSWGPPHIHRENPSDEERNRPSPLLLVSQRPDTTPFEGIAINDDSTDNLHLSTAFPPPSPAFPALLPPYDPHRMEQTPNNLGDPAPTLRPPRQTTPTVTLTRRAPFGYLPSGRMRMRMSTRPAPHRYNNTPDTYAPNDPRNAHHDDDNEHVPSLRAPSAALLEMDGLGDRQRSLSPSLESAWDTLLTTITPDQQLPSVGSSFTSAASAASLPLSHPTTAATSMTEDHEEERRPQQDQNHRDVETMAEINTYICDTMDAEEEVDVNAEISTLRDLLTELVRREDIPDEFWHRMGLRRLVPWGSNSSEEEEDEHSNN
ncbi:MAG: hypothetical protein M1823_004286 [Watsoniomyces obsoletus]|nr:MAG: hypothetical protein M1823_004286 [Watsoniomyces obsoletus]